MASRQGWLDAIQAQRTIRTETDFAVLSFCYVTLQAGNVFGGDLEAVRIINFVTR